LLKTFISQFSDPTHLKFEVLQMNACSRDGSFSMKVDTKTDGIITVSSNTVELNENGLLLSTVTMSDTSGFERYEVQLRQVGNNFVIEEANVIGNGTSGSTRRASWTSRYQACIGRVLDTDQLLGQTIAVAGLAGGIGCLACGIAAATLFGFGALGCAGG
jgi:hypothetical protein